LSATTTASTDRPASAGRTGHADGSRGAGTGLAHRGPARPRLPPCDRGSARQLGVTELYDGLRSRQQRVAVRALQIRPQRVPEIGRQHRAIIDELAANDVDGVAVLLDEHLRPTPEITAALG
jgi:hypothetical protein